MRRSLTCSLVGIIIDGATGTAGLCSISIFAIATLLGTQVCCDSYLSLVTSGTRLRSTVRRIDGTTITRATSHGCLDWRSCHTIYSAGLNRKQEVTVKNVFYSSNGPAYFWRAKHKQQIVFYLYFYNMFQTKERKEREKISRNIWKKIYFSNNLSWSDREMQKSREIRLRRRRSQTNTKQLQESCWTKRSSKTGVFNSNWSGVCYITTAKMVPRLNHIFLEV